MGRGTKRIEERVGRQRQILDTLKLRGPMTAAELTRRLGGGAVAMRVHLRHLAAAGLVTHEEERRPVGRPARRFRLTPSAESLFPKQYELLAERLMEAIASEVGPDALHRIFANWENELASRLDRSLPADEDERLNGLARHQSSFGFMASVHRARTGAALIEQNCPIAAIAARFPEICDHEAALFRRVLGRDVELRACQARGGLRCEFLVGEPPQTPPGEP